MDECQPGEKETESHEAFGGVKEVLTEDKQATAKVEPEAGFLPGEDVEAPKTSPLLPEATFDELVLEGIEHLPERPPAGLPTASAGVANPGAYAMPGVPVFYRPPPANNDVEIPLRSNDASNEDAILTEATPVDDWAARASLQQAQQVFPRHDHQERKGGWPKPAGVICYILACVGVVATIVSIIGSQKGNGGQVEQPVTEEPSISMEPSSETSSAPTGSFDLFLSDLPDSTLASLERFGTPQWNALEWLTNHPNIIHYPEWKKKQLFALATFYYSFEGPTWHPLLREKWMDYNKDECLWYSAGFGYILLGTYNEQPPNFQEPPCNELGHFTSLFLANLEMTGSNPFIPEEVSQLTSLEALSLLGINIEHSLADVVPFESIASLPHFWDISIAVSNITGSIPSELGLLHNVRKITIMGNQLTGTIPNEVSQLSHLDHFDTSFNFLTGHLPKELGLLTKLVDLLMMRNHLTGPVPTELTQLTNLVALLLTDMPLTGTIPSEIGLLTQLQSLILSSTDMSGTIPSELGIPAELNTVLLDEIPLLTGTIPTELSHLHYLNLTGSYGLTGTIPRTLCYLKNDTCINPGPVPYCALDFACTDILCGCDCQCPDT